MLLLDPSLVVFTSQAARAQRDYFPRIRNEGCKPLFMKLYLIHWQGAFHKPVVGVSRGWDRPRSVAAGLSMLDFSGFQTGHSLLGVHAAETWDIISMQSCRSHS